MKKFDTLDDLNQIKISVPLQKLRIILTLAGGRFKSTRQAVELINQGVVPASELYARILRDEMRAFEDVQYLVARGIRDNVSREDETRLVKIQHEETKKLHEEMRTKLKDTMELIGSNPFNSMDPQSKTKDAKDIEEEFGVDLPDDGIIVPGGEREN